MRIGPGVGRRSSVVAALSLTLLSVGCGGDGEAASADGEGWDPPKAVVPAEVRDVVIHPIVADPMECTEHAVGTLGYVGDALGIDCTVVRYDSGPDGRFSSEYEHDGGDNEDWHGWHATLLAPFDGTVTRVHVNSVTNRPGRVGEGPASSVTFVDGDGINVVYAHVEDVRVRAGDHVTAGEPVARVGNNGVSYHPHTHVGAWRGSEPLQVRFDLHAMGLLRADG